MEREGFIFYASWWEGISELSNDKIKLEVLTAIMEYGLYGKQPENLGDTSRAMFRMAKAVIDANNKRYQDGKKGGRPKKDKGSDGLGNDDGVREKPQVSELKTSGYESKNPLCIYTDTVTDTVTDFFSDTEKKRAKKILFEKGLIGTSAQTEIERYASYNIAKGIKLKNKIAGLKLWDIQAKDRIPEAAVKTLTGFFKVAGDEFTDAFLNDVRRIYMDDEGINIVCSEKVEQWMESYNDNPTEAMIDWKRKKKYAIYFLR